MSIFTRQQRDEPAELAPIEPPPDIARRLAQVRADDIASYVQTGGDLDAWPDGWNVPSSDFYIKPQLRPLYHRDRSDDIRVIQDLREHAKRVSRSGGVVEQVTREGADRACHLHALRRAEAHRQRAEHDAREARLDNSERRCVLCGVTGDHTVRARPSTEWCVTNPREPSLGVAKIVFAPRACDACAPELQRQLDALLVRRAEQCAADQTPNGPRRDAVSAYLAQRAPELAWINSTEGRIAR